MIPISLTLKNLLSYGEGVPTLDFTPFHVACISGKNGHGKSALLDAITWALWGEARKPPGERKPDESLLRIGATDMRVDFEFELEDDRYRVIRSYRKTGKSNVSNLELQIFDPAAGYRTLSEDGSIRKTQARINGLMRMSYDTFTNAAFLLQGHADEFTRRSARERKTILAEILGLSRYDELASLARLHLQQFEIEAGGIRRELDDIAEAVERKPDLTRDLAAAAQALKTHESALAQIESQLEAARTAHAKMEFNRKEREDLGGTQSRLQTDSEQTQKQSEKLTLEIAAHDELIQKREQILAEADLFSEAQAKETGLRQGLNELRSLELEQNRLEKAITEARHEIQREMAEWEARVREGEGDVSEADEIIQQKDEIAQGIADLMSAREQAKNLEAKRDERLVLEQAVGEHRRTLEAQVTKARVALESLQAQRGSLEQAAACAETGSRNLAAAREQEAVARRIEDERGRIRDEGTRLTSQIQAMDERKPALEREINALRRRREELEKADGPECPLCGSELDDDHRKIVHQQLQQEHDALTKEKSESFERLKSLTESRDDYRRKFQELKNQLTAMGDIPAAVARAETALREAEDARVRLAALESELGEKQKALACVECEGPEAKALAEVVARMEAVVYDVEAHRIAREAIERLTPLEGRKLQLETAEKKRAEALAILPDHRRKRDAARLTLEDGKYAEAQQAALKQALEKIAALAYDPDAHRAVSQDLERYKDAGAMKERLLSAERERTGALARLNEAEEKQAEIAERARQLEARAAELDELLATSSQISADMSTLQESRRLTRAERDGLLQEKASLQTQLDRCSEQESSRDECRKRLNASERQIRIYKELVIAFGKDGIQALLIEQAIPDIEEEANRILGRLTDHRTQITLESLRDLKKGGTRETLDIRISDELGERSYELYSGGEAFRVDFAIRIALSRLLAHRSGTRLRTLVIDEGFGTQDTEGLDRLVEAIQSIRDDFEKIIVITHVESLKNAFPVRIEVTKHPDIGSRYEIVS